MTTSHPHTSAPRVRVSVAPSLAALPPPRTRTPNRAGSNLSDDVTWYIRYPPSRTRTQKTRHRLHLRPTPAPPRPERTTAPRPLAIGHLRHPPTPRTPVRANLERRSTQCIAPPPRTWTDAPHARPEPRRRLFDRRLHAPHRANAFAHLPPSRRMRLPQHRAALSWTSRIYILATKLPHRLGTRQRIRP
ncbi:hypothetical protein C8J57DRAFT_1628767 [Mycena rebaudengoi]|nr:hypothetical protein C8J57DRAFT_1628767 [Mycena rebaudengoi]